MFLPPLLNCKQLEHGAGVKVILCESGLFEMLCAYHLTVRLQGSSAPTLRKDSMGTGPLRTRLTPEQIESSAPPEVFGDLGG